MRSYKPEFLTDLFRRARRPSILLRFASTLLFALLLVQPAVGQKVEVQLSSKRAYVGQPVILQIKIANAEDVEQPVLPQVDGLRIESRGAPARSSVTTIINNRRSQSQSVTYQFAITPTKPGEFVIPAFQINVDGLGYKVDRQQLSVETSETGDLLIVEIESPLSQVFVGQQLPVTLKVWIRPFTDDERKVRLSERDMWQLLSRSSDWGFFDKKLQELASNRRRPAGTEVYRENEQGAKIPYFLYEIDANYYPLRPGAVSFPEIEIKANYPTELGRVRSGLSVFDEQSWDSFDRLFGDSPVRSNQLAVTATRPISAAPLLPQINVIDVPTAGRPDDYRGAVGKYRFVARTSVQEVAEGDPINLQLLIQGKGPMELVSGPRLSTYQPLIQDFQVSEDPAAGVVQDDVKLFWTTLRPRNTSVTEIPPLPFSFFDPEAEEFVTVYSDPIPIKVKPSESLSLDAIVAQGETRPNRLGIPPLASRDEQVPLGQEPVFIQYSADEVLAWQRSERGWLWAVWIFPPICWLLLWAVSGRKTLLSLWPRSARSKLVTSIRRARFAGDIATALEDYYSTPLPAPVADVHRQCLQAAYGPIKTESLEEMRQLALEVVDRHRSHAPAASLSSMTGLSRLAGSGKTALSALLAASLGLVFAGAASAWDQTKLTMDQQKLILAEANALFEKGLECQVKCDQECNLVCQADQRLNLEQAIKKYEILLNYGIENPRLLQNLGNAYFLGNDYYRALASYEHARRLDPYNYSILEKLNAVKREIQSVEPSSSVPWRQKVIEWNRWVPTNISKTIALVSWVVLWLGLILSLLNSRQTIFPVTWQRGLLLIVIAVGSLTLISWQLAERGEDLYDGLVIVDEAIVHEADDDRFAIVGQLSAGEPTRVISRRGDWVEVIGLSENLHGWLRADSLYQFAN